MYFVICSATLETLMCIQNVQSGYDPPGKLKSLGGGDFMYDYNNTNFRLCIVIGNQKKSETLTDRI